MKNLDCIYENFTGKDEFERLDLMEELLINADFKKVYVKGNGKGSKKGNYHENYIFYSEDSECVFVFIVKYRKFVMKRCLPAIVPKDLYINKLGLFSKRPKLVFLKSHSHEDAAGVPAISIKLENGCTNKALHKILLEVTDDEEVDHICIHEGLAIPELLRACTSKQNKQNKPNAKIRLGDDFDYKAIRDFSNSFYIPFLHYVMNAITKDEMWELRRMELANS